MSDPDQDISVTAPTRPPQKRRTTGDTMHGVCSYMGWTHVPNIESNTSSADDNPFAAPKQQPVGKVSVNLPTDYWLCTKLDSLTLTHTGIHPEAQRQGVCRGINLSSTSNLRLNGTGSTPTRTDQLDLCPSDLVTSVHVAG